MHNGDAVKRKCTDTCTVKGKSTYRVIAVNEPKQPSGTPETGGDFECAPANISKIPAQTVSADTAVQEPHVIIW